MVAHIAVGDCSDGLIMAISDYYFVGWDVDSPLGANGKEEGFEMTASRRDDAHCHFAAAFGEESLRSDIRRG